MGTTEHEEPRFFFILNKGVEKPRDFDPFGQTGFAHLWLQYD